jgi:hypothetical protein
MKTTMTELEAAERALEAAISVRDDLARQRAAAEAQRQELSEKRKRLALRALTGSAARRHKLDEVTAQAAQVQLRLEDIGFATDAAEAEITTSTAAVHSAISRRKAAEIRDELLPQLRAVGFKCAAALDTFAEAVPHFLELSNEIGRRGGGLSFELARVNLARSVDSRLYTAGRLNMRGLDRAPSQILSIEALIEKFCANAAARVEAMLSDAPEPVDPVDDPEEEAA